MGKRILIINTQSFVDVITNSSSELFICNTNKSLDAVKDILKDMLEKSDYSTSFEDAFGDVQYISSVDTQLNDSWWSGMPKTEEDAKAQRRKEILENKIWEEVRDNNMDWNERNKLVDKRVQDELTRIHRLLKFETIDGGEMDIPEWWYTLKDPSDRYYTPSLDWRERYIGKVIITSNGDNSIPYDLFDEIENTFDADRRHLG